MIIIKCFNIPIHVDPESSIAMTIQLEKGICNFTSALPQNHLLTTSKHSWH